MNTEKTGKLDELIDGAEELLTKLGDADDPRIQELRDRIDHAIGDTRRAIAGQNLPSVRVRDIAGTIDDYIRDYPWLAVATGVLAAGTAAYIAGAVVGAQKRQVRDWR